jgi:phosphoenolpyruvate carboxykinase (ATP)
MFMVDNCKIPASDSLAMENNETHNKICDDDGSAPTVKANTIDELHSLQRKKNITPSGSQIDLFTLSEDERNKQQLQSIRYFVRVTIALCVQ